MAKIFIIEDDPVLRQELAAFLTSSGHTPAYTTHWKEAAREAVTAAPDLVVLDLQLPDTSGLDICRRIRESSDVPIIMLTSSDSEQSEVMGMNVGADDYVTKPYRPPTLLARITALLRRYNLATPADSVTVGGVTLNVMRSEVAYKDKTIEITRNEARILALLMRNAGHPISRQELMVELWQSDVFIADNTLAVNVARLRHKLSSISISDDFLTTVRGVGYLISA